MEKILSYPIFKSDNLKLSDFIKQNPLFAQTIDDSDIPSEYTDIFFHFLTEKKSNLDFFLILENEQDNKLFCLNGHIGINGNNNSFCAQGLYSSFDFILKHKKKLPQMLQNAIEEKIYLFQEKLQIECLEKDNKTKIKI